MTADKSGKSGCAWSAAIFIGVCAIVGIATHTTEKPPPPKTPEQVKAEEKANVDLTTATIGAAALRSAMRNPKSFELAQVWHATSGAICYTYRAQNGFGGLDVGYAVFQNGKMRGSDDAGFSSAWKHSCAQKPGEDLTALVDTALEMRAFAPK